MPSTLPFVEQLWAALDGPAEFASAVAETGIGALPSAFRVSDLAVAAIGVAGLATAESAVQADHPSATVDRALASRWYRAALTPVGWTLSEVWDPLAGNYRTTDGWIRLHTNAPRHRAAALRVVGVGSDSDAVSRAVGTWSAVGLERAISEAGGCAAAMRTRVEWLAHPQGAAVADEPLLDWRILSAGPTAPRWMLTRERPLAGVRVLDLTRILAGPVATRFLASLGADVLRIDPPDWDERAIVPDMTLGKRAARVDASTAEGRERMRVLIADCDVLVHGYRNGALDALGFGANERSAIRPGLVEVSLDAYGFTGPWSERRGFDSLVQMSSGIADAGMVWAGSEEPVPLPVQALDHSAGYLMAAAALRGLVMQRSDGLGRAVRTSLARVAETLVGGGPQVAGFPPVGAADASEPIETPWGSARLLPPAVRIPGVALRFDLGPRDLGSDGPRWE